MSRSSQSSQKLNRRQRQAVCHGVTGDGKTIAGPLLILAGPGTGKTKTLTHRAVHLLDRGADKGRIMMLTFTRRAAAEMTARVERLIGDNSRGMRDKGVRRISWAGTFHAVGQRLLRRYGNRIGLDAGFTILDREDSVDLMHMAMQELKLGGKGSDFPSKHTCFTIYSRMVNAQQKLKPLLKQHFPVAVEHRRQLAKLFSAYVAAKKDQNVLDFDDLLVYWDLLLTDDGLARTIGGQFDHILVDEYQDTNVLQASILRRMKPDGSGVTVVGDDAQSIYRFRAAEVRNILDFGKQFTKPATTVKLVRNYRSTAPILTASNAVINLATEGFTKSLTTKRKGGSKPCLVTVNDDHAQAQFVANEIATQHDEGRELKHMAVLYRSNHHSMMLQAELARCGIAFKVFGGAKFTESKHIKDVLAVLKWAENPSDKISGFRVLSLLPGIGGATAKRVLDAVVTASGPVAALTAFAPPPRARASWPALVKLMDRLHETKSLWPGEFDAVLRWYRPLLEETMDDFTNRWADLQQLQVIAGTYTSRRKLLTDLTLDPPSKQKKPELNETDDDALTLSTIHSGKGREWHTVYVLSVVEGCLPSSKAKSAGEREEERRLLYVAMTRAKRNLTLIVPWRYAQFGQWNDSATVPRSSFIPDEILGHFDQRAWRPGDDDDDNDDTRFDAGGKPALNLLDRAQQLWI